MIDDAPMDADELDGLDGLLRRVDPDRWLSSRFIGDPARRINEDFLRILRFFRIHAAYGQGEPDRNAVEACIAARDGLASLSAERLRMEMLKLVVAKGAADALVDMDDGGLLGRITAGVSYHGPFANMVEAERMLGFADVRLWTLTSETSNMSSPPSARRCATRSFTTSCWP